MRLGLLAACLGLGALAACVPADEAIGLGSVEFTFTASSRTRNGVLASETVDADAWALHFDRVVLGFKTMTIGKIGVTDVCAYRGRGEVSDVVFDPRFGVVQSFNGIQPTDCPDVGLIFGTPGPETVPGQGVTSKELIELATGAPAHGIVEVTATQDGGFGSQKKRILLRFDTEQTSTRFGGCREVTRGVRILAGERDDVPVHFAAEHLFRDALIPTANLRVQPFIDADAIENGGNGDGVVTMSELDMIPLRRLSPRYGEGYVLPNGGRSGTLADYGTFGDYVRVLFRFAIMFRSEDGLCVGNEPGSEEGGQPAPEP